MDYYGTMSFVLMTIRQLALLGIPVAAVAWNGTAAAQTTPERVVRAEARQAAERGALFYETLLGELNVQAGQPQVGYALLLQAARRSGESPLYQRAVELALQSRSGEHALQAARAWKSAQPASDAANRYLLQIAIALNQIAETGPLLQQLLAQAPAGEVRPLLQALPSMYARASDKGLAATVVEQGLEFQLQTPEHMAWAWTALGFVRLAAGQKAQALDAARKGGSVDAAFPDHLRLLLALMQAGVPEAEILLQARTAHTPLPHALELVHAEILVEQNRTVAAEAALQSAVRQAPDHAESWLALARLATRMRQWDKAVQAAQQALQLGQGMPTGAGQEKILSEALLALANLADKRKDLVSMARWLEQVPASTPPGRTAYQRALLLARRGNLDQARQLLQALPDQEPLFKLQLEVQLLQDVERLPEAMALQATWAQQQPDDPDVQYNLAMLAEKNGQAAYAETLLRRLLAQHPDYHHAYNALGYLLTQRNAHLPEARQLILKALSASPLDPLITDSLGWVEYRLGNTIEALRLLETAYRARPDAEIAAHWGEVLWHQGAKEQAKQVWTEGQLLDPENTTLQDTLQRLKDQD